MSITYILGAGASANALPLVTELPIHLTLMGDYVKNYLELNEDSEFLKDLNDLAGELNEYNTIDNYARVLCQNKTVVHDLKLNKLKSLLCSLFMFEQLKKKQRVINRFDNVSSKDIERINRTIDPRYKSFFAKILSKDKLNNQINILSWNYDMQLEIGIENNLGFHYDHLGTSFQIFPHPSCEFDKRYCIPVSHNQSQIVKLNGTAGIFFNDGLFKSIYGSQQTTFDEAFKNLLEIHNEVSRQEIYNPFLKFAWEQDEKTEEAVRRAQRIISKTEILIVIGYSFPDFNRNIDNKIFSNNRFDEIFVQLPEFSFQSVKYNMRASIGNKASESINISNLTDFFIPIQFIPDY